MTMTEEVARSVSMMTYEELLAFGDAMKKVVGEGDGGRQAVAGKLLEWSDQEMI